MASNLLGMVDSDSEDDLGGVAKGRAATDAATRPPARDSVPAPKRGRPPAAASAAAAATKSKVSKPVQQTAAARRAADKRSAAAAAAAVAAAEATDAAEAEAAVSSGHGRRALADKTNEQANEPTEAGATKKRGRGRPKAAPKVVEVDTQDAEDADAEEASGEATRPAKASTGTTRQAGHGAAATAPAEDEEGNRSGGDDEDEDEPQVPQTRPVDPMEIDSDMRSGTQAVAQKKASSDSSKSGNSYSGLQSPFRPSQRPTSKPSGSLLSDGASSDVAVRRRLGDLTKKYDALEARYRDLKEIGIKEAERNFDRLKKQSETRAKNADDLIASLRDELAHYRGLAKEGDRAKRDLEASEARATDLQAQVSQLKADLGDSQAEAKTLATKLAAARSATADSAAAALPLGVVPSSAMKKKTALIAGQHRTGGGGGPGLGLGGHGSHNSLPAAVVEAMQASSQTAQLKEDLYGDLTGLLVRSAKRETTTEPGGGGSRVREMYDCIQTGRNGSLHFKLCLDTGAAASSDVADKAGADDARFVYTPQIDPNRDAVLIERLPDYLVEEISFPRAQAAKFYKRVMQSLMEERYSY